MVNKKSKFSWFNQTVQKLVFFIAILLSVFFIHNYDKLTKKIELHKKNYSNMSVLKSDIVTYVDTENDIICYVYHNGISCVKL